MKIKTGEIADKSKDKNVVSSVKLSKGTRVGTLKLTVNGEEQDSVPIRGLGGGSSTVIGGSVDTQALWDAINKKVDIDFFKNLFTVYDSSDIEIATNTYTRKPDNLKISVGTWTEEYLSALGKNSEGGGGGGVGTVIGIALGTGTTPIYPDDDTGIVTLPAYPTKVSQLVNDSGFVTSSTLNNYVTSSYLVNNFYTKAQADSKYMTIAAFESLFNALDSNGDKINHPYSSGVDSIKALVGLWTEQYLSALGQNSEGGSSGGGSVNAIKVGTNPDTYLDPVEGIIDMSNYVTTAAQRTLWTNSAHTHSNKAVLDNITAGQVAAWNNMAAIMGEDQDDIINKWNEVVAFLSTYTEADTLANLLSNKLDVDFFRRIFTVYDEDGNIIVPNTYTQVADNLKILVGTWTEEYLSALGKNSEGGGGGTGTVTSVKIASNPDVFIDPVDGIIDMSSYATTWNNKQDAISDLTTIRSNASNGNTAYSWGNHANAGYAQASNTVSNVAYNTTGKKLTKTINGDTTDIVSASTLVTDGGGAKASTTITAGNGLTGGGDLSSNRTINVVSANAAITVNADNIKLNVINDYTTTTNNTIIPLAAAKGKDLNDRLAVLESWFEVDADGNIKTKDMPNGTHRGFYTESFVSALGSNSSGGGSSTFDEDMMWTALQSTSGTYATTKIATSHIPDTSSTYGYLKSSALNGYATQSWVNQQGFLTTHQTLYTLSIYGGTTKVLDFKPNANASIYIKAGGDISLTNDTTNKYITLSYTHPTNGANTTISAANGKVLSAITVNSLGHVTSVSSKTLASADIPDISATYATASRATTLEGYFTDGVAKIAAKLNTGTTTYTAWGQTYWSSGLPQSISGNMTSVGSITPSANGNALGTTSARFNIYGTAGNFSGNVSITGTLGVTGATTLSSTLSVAGGITLTTTKKIYFGDTSHYLELDSTGFHFSHGVYSDSFVSALGANSSGGGGGGIDIEAMWAELQGNTGTYANTKINVNHIPDISSTYGYAKTSQLGSYLPLSGGTLTNVLTIATGADKKLIIDNTDTETKDSLISFRQNGTEYGTLGTWGNDNLLWKGNIVINTNNIGSYALPLSGGTMSNTNLVTNLNADLLDGHHASYFATASSLSNYVPMYPNDNYDLNELGAYGGMYRFNSSPTNAFPNAAYGNTLVVGSGYGYDTCFQLGAPYGTSELYFKTGSWHSDGTGTFRTNSWRQVAFVDSNVASATKATQDGSGNVITSKYVTIDTAQTISGDKTITGSIIMGTHSILGANETGGAMSYFDGSRTVLGSVGATSTKATHLRSITGHLTVGNSNTASYNVLDSGNYTDYTVTKTGTGASGTWGISVTGNAATATKLQTPRTIWGQSFDGSSDVSGSITGATTITASGRISASAFEGNFVTDGTVFYFGNSQHAIGSGTDAVLWAYGANSLLFYTNGSKRMTINSEGSVGIGTSSPSYKLDVSGAIRASGNVYVGTGGADGNTFVASNSATNIYLQNSSGSVLVCDGKVVRRGATSSLADVTLGSSSYPWGGLYSTTGSFSGNVGIGTTTPGYKLGVAGTFGVTGKSTMSGCLNITGSNDGLDQGIRIHDIASASSVWFRCTNASGADAGMIGITGNASGLLFRLPSTSTGTAFNTYMLIAYGGNVGIGNTSPSQKLHVTGNILASGEVTASSDERLKTIVGDGNLDLRYIANAPNILFKWNNGQDDKVHGGSLAQYFLTGAKHFVLGSDKDYYSLNYGALATSMAISIAKEVVRHDDEITRLKKEVVKLRERVEELEERRVA